MMKTVRKRINFRPSFCGDRDCSICFKDVTVDDSDAPKARKPRVKKVKVAEPIAAIATKALENPSVTIDTAAKLAARVAKSSTFDALVSRPTVRAQYLSEWDEEVTDLEGDIIDAFLDATEVPAVSEPRARKVGE